MTPRAQCSMARRTNSSANVLWVGTKPWAGATSAVTCRRCGTPGSTGGRSIACPAMGWPATCHPAPFLGCVKAATARGRGLTRSMFVSSHRSLLLEHYRYPKSTRAGTGEIASSKLAPHPRTRELEVSCPTTGSCTAGSHPYPQNNIPRHGPASKAGMSP